MSDEPVTDESQPAPTPPPRDRTARPVFSGDSGGSPPAPWEIGGNNQPPVNFQQPQFTGGRPPGHPDANSPNYQPPRAPWEQGGPAAQPVWGSPPARETHADQDPFKSLPVHMRADTGDAAEQARKIVLGTLIAIGLLIAGFLIYVLVPIHVAAPNGLNTYVSPDKSFQIDVPSGWGIKTDTTKSSDVPNNELLVRSNAAKIDLVMAPASDLIRNMILGGGNVTPVDSEKDPAGALQAVTVWRGSYTHSNYHEQLAQAVNTNFGPSDYSEFTGTGGLFGWGGPMHGYRASASDGGTSYLLILECPENNWAALAPTFMKVIQSLGPGDGSVYTPPTDTPDNGTGASSGNSDGTTSPDGDSSQDDSNSPDNNGDGSQ